ncbi:MAG: DUF4884 domain-containing protein [Prevotella sp.]|nr:DUF4884 domain-containing protein [Prevotella sp.]
MKTLVLLSAVVTILIVGLSSCAAPIYSKPAGNNQGYTVDYLFEHDGCKVYRFQDRGKYVYFTNCTGNVTGITGDSTRVETIVRAK